MVSSPTAGKVSLVGRFENLMEAEASLRGQMSFVTGSDPTGSEPEAVSHSVSTGPSTDLSQPDPMDPIAATSAQAQSDPAEYERLQLELLLTTLGVGLGVTLCVALVYSPLMAGNYGLGLLGGMLYLRMLGRSVAQLGKTQARLGSTRFAVLIGLIVLAAKLPSLQILPIFFGFLSYKIALLVHLFQVLFRPSRRSQ